MSYTKGDLVTYKGEEYVVMEQNESGKTYKLAKPDTPDVATSGWVRPTSLTPRTESKASQETGKEKGQTRPRRTEKPTPRKLDLATPKQKKKDGDEEEEEGEEEEEEQDEEGEEGEGGEEEGEEEEEEEEEENEEKPQPKEGEKKIGKVHSKTIGYSEVATVRLGPKGPIPTNILSEWIWGAQFWTSPSKKAIKGLTKEQLKELKKEQLSVRLVHLGQDNDSLRDKRLADTFVIDRGGSPVQVGPKGKEVDFAFPLSNLTAVDVHNGTCKLEFLRDSGKRVRGGPLVVLTFHEKGVLTTAQWRFIEALSSRLEQKDMGGQKTEGDADKSGGVRLGLHNEVEWLPQRYTRYGRWVQRVLLLLVALAAAVAPAKKMYESYVWVTTSSLDAVAVGLQAGVFALCFDVAHWLWSGVMLMKKLLGGVNQLIKRGNAVVTEEEDGEISPLSPLSLLSPASPLEASDKKKR